MSNPDIDSVVLDAGTLAFTNRVLSSESLAAQIADRIRRRIPTSVIRQSDGELGFIRYAQQSQAGRTPTRAWYMYNAGWLKRYGVEGADYAEIGRALLYAGKNADYLGCPIAGTYWDDFASYTAFPERTQFVDQFYPLFWEAAGRVGPILRMSSIMVLHHEATAVCEALVEKYDLDVATGFPLNNWRDHTEARMAVMESDAGIILVSGGPMGKAFCVDLARDSGRVVLDVGEALGKVWCKWKGASP
jgi:hypothetical protein